MYRGQFGEFVCGYWGLKGYLLCASFVSQLFEWSACKLAG